jgi:gluconate 2-dehydrogenase gamma chain
MKDNSSSTDETRRELLTRMGTGLVAITVSSARGQVSPEQARARGETLRQLSEAEGKTLESLGDVLLPGAAAAGIAHYVDDQLSSETPLLMLKYVDYPGPFLDFYQQGLRSLDSLGRARHDSSFHELSSARKVDLVREVSQKNPPGWTGPPGPLFYFVTRNDAVDVCYGTPEGFAKLNIPYMAHILPRRKW